MYVCRCRTDAAAVVEVDYRSRLDRCGCLVSGIDKADSLVASGIPDYGDAGAECMVSDYHQLRGRGITYELLRNGRLGGWILTFEMKSKYCGRSNGVDAKLPFPSPWLLPYNS